MINLNILISLLVVFILTIGLRDCQPVQELAQAAQRLGRPLYFLPVRGQQETWQGLPSDVQSRTRQASGMLGQQLGAEQFPSQQNVDQDDDFGLGAGAQLGGARLGGSLGGGFQ